MSEPVLQVKGLKTYYYTEEGVVPAVDGLDFEVIPKRASSPQWTDWISRWSRAKRLLSSAKAAAASL